MESTIKFEIKDFLRSGNAQSKEYNIEQMKKWGAPGYKVLTDISTAQDPVEHATLRSRAMYALAVLPGEEKEKSIIFSKLIKEDPSPSFRFQAYNALVLFNKEEAAKIALELTIKPEENPALALAAARIMASNDGEKARDAITTLRSKILAMAEGNEFSPSVQSLDRLLNELGGNKKATRSQDANELKPIK
jgi:hypothetical protein